MELKEYQQRAVEQVRAYLTALEKWCGKSAKVVEVAGPEAALDCPAKAWADITDRPYLPQQDGVGCPLANFCLKVPTGGGKTLLAVKAIDAINAIYRKRQTGLVLWIVPTSQIYHQTIVHLRDRDHPYRQHLDIASGGRTLIVEKTDRFNPLDLAQNLVVLMLMLPSANRETKETLKIFQDSGGFADFFPAEDQTGEHRKLLARFPNLDTFAESGFFGKQIKTSLGNTLRLVSPIVILDEGHKAYGSLAQKTIRGFNPCIVVELSATPTEESNVLVDIKGIELEREGMIKLDLHVLNKATNDWKVAMLAAKNKRDELEKTALTCEASSGRYIRPICLIQSERVGKDQRGRGFIHADDVREYLIRTCGVPEQQVAIKTSERDDIEGLDLFSRDCEIRYIVTKAALQEGWDCSFAYVLAVLTNPGARNSLTQLVGRVLRQPDARKTGVKALDESYVYCFRQQADGLLQSIRKGFSEEGLGDLQSRVSIGESEEDSGRTERTIALRDKFEPFRDKIYLPIFVIKDKGTWRKVSYECDILSRIDWAKADFSALGSLPLQSEAKADTDMVVALSRDEREVIEAKDFIRIRQGAAEIDSNLVTRQLVAAIPNPWIAHEVVEIALRKLIKTHGARVVASNLVFIIDELKKKAESENDRLAERVFKDLITKKAIRFMMFREPPGYRLPSQIKASAADRTLTREDGSQLELSLFPFVAEGAFNDAEKAVAWYLDEQMRLVWWYRNIAKKDYAVQGWRKNRIYPDFIAADADGRSDDFASVYVVETKGTHLKNEDTDYKKDVFALCNKLAEEKSWTELGLELPQKKIRFEVVFEEEWQRRLGQMFGPPSRRHSR